MRSVPAGLRLGAGSTEELLGLPRADRERHAPTEGDDADEDGEQDVRHPPVDAPVVDGHEDGLLGALGVILNRHLRVRVVERPRVPAPTLCDRGDNPREPL